MKKNIIARMILLIITFSLVVCMFTSVFATDDIPSLDDDFNFTNTSTDGNNTENNVDNSIGNNATGNSIDNSIGNNTENSIGNSIGNNTGNSIGNSNSSSYQESNIPYAGPETSILTIVAFVICGIIGIYTFMKLSDYSNI